VSMPPGAGRARSSWCTTSRSTRPGPGRAFKSAEGLAEPVTYNLHRFDALSPTYRRSSFLRGTTRRASPPESSHPADDQMPTSRGTVSWPRPTVHLWRPRRPRLVLGPHPAEPAYNEAPPDTVRCTCTAARSITAQVRCLDRDDRESLRQVSMTTTTRGWSPSEPDHLAVPLAPGCHDEGGREGCDRAVDPGEHHR
jgi:hypothetical protein